MFHQVQKRNEESGGEIGEGIVNLKDMEVKVPAEEDVRKSYAMHSLLKSGSVLIRSLPSYKCDFEYHILIVQAHMEALSLRRQSCGLILLQISNQNAAFAAAALNLKLFFDTISDSAKNLIRDANLLKKSKFEIVDTFETSLLRLRGFDLHPALQNRDRKTLLDCVNEASLREWFSKTLESFERFQARILKFETSFFDLDFKVRTLCTAGLEVVSSWNLDSVDAKTKEWNQEQEKIWQQFNDGIPSLFFELTLRF